MSSAALLMAEPLRRRPNFGFIERRRKHTQKLYAESTGMESVPKAVDRVAECEVQNVTLSMADTKAQDEQHESSASATDAAVHAMQLVVSETVSSDALEVRKFDKSATDDNQLTRLSVLLKDLLRHRAKQECIDITEDGWVLVSDALKYVSSHNHVYYENDIVQVANGAGAGEQDRPRP